MKKFIIFLLCAVLVLSMCACTGNPDSDESNTTTTGASTAAFSVGYGREDITPNYPVELSGYESGRMSTGTKDPLYVTCIAITDAEDNTVLLMTCDLGSAPTREANSVRRKVSKETGVPYENILFASTHNHSAPYCTSIDDLLTKGSVEAAETAMADRSASEIYIGTAKTEKLNFVRHYLLSDGTYAGDNYGVGHSYVDYETEADNEMQLMRFVRSEGKDIVLMNWQAHPVTGGESNSLITADYIGFCRLEMENELDCHFAYFQGAAGNLNPRSRFTADNLTPNADSKAHGEALANYALNAMSNLTKVEGGGIQVKSWTYTGTVRETDPEVLAAFSTFSSVYGSTGNREEACLATGRLVNSIFTIYRHNDRVMQGATKDLPLSVVSVGDISFAAVPYEMFDTNGKYVKDNTPFEMTFILGYCNGHEGYMPSQLSCDNGCYEYDNSYFVAGTAEELADLYLDALAELKQ